MKEEEIKINPVYYWWYVTYVNPDIKPDKGFPVHKVGKVYGTNDKKQNFYIIGKDKNYHRISDYHKRELIPHILKGENWDITWKTIQKYIDSKKKLKE